MYCSLGPNMLKKAFKLQVALLLACTTAIPQAICAEPPAAIDGSAIDRLQAKLDAEPSNADLMRQLAAAQAAAGRYAAALETIDRAQLLAPEDNDIALARARILLWSGRKAEARKQAAIVRSRAPDYPELDAVDAALNAPEAERSTHFGFALSAGLADIKLAGGQNQNWENLAVSGFANADENTTLTATIEHERRQANDTRFSLMATHANASQELRFGISYTPSADFKEDWGLQGGADFRVHPNLTLLSDIRYADYGNISVFSAIPGVKFHSRDESHSLALKLISISPSDSGTKFGASARYDRKVDNRFRLFGGVASYPDTEAGVTRQLRSAFGGASVALADSVSMIVTGEYDRRERSYTRKAINLALIFRLAD